MEINFEYANNFRDDLIDKIVYEVRTWLGPMFLYDKRYYIDEKKIEYIRVKDHYFMAVFHDRARRYLSINSIGKLFTDKAEAEAYCEFLNCPD